MKKKLLKRMNAYSKTETIFATEYHNGMEDAWIVKKWIDSDNGYEMIHVIFNSKKAAKKYAKENHLDARFVPVFLEPVSEYEYNLLCEYGYSDNIIEDNGKYYQYEEIEEDEDSWVMYKSHRLFVVGSSPWELGYKKKSKSDGGGCHK